MSEVRAAVYLRISEDPRGTGLANERQREDCLRILRERGWSLYREFSDTESASDKRKVRAGYNAMLSDYRAGRFDALVCWDLDRLTRQPRQLEDWIDAAEENGLRLVTANGEADLQTDGGRLYARIKAAVARGEVERKAARQRAQAKQAAERGMVTWTNRPFGYENIGTKGSPQWVLKPDEAALIAQAYKDILHGTTPTEVARRWSAAGASPVAGGTRWRGSRVSDVLMSRRNVAQSTYKGEVVGAGQWPATVDLETWEAVHAILSSPSRPGNRNPRRGSKGGTPTTLLSGIVTCAVCGEGVVRHMGPKRNDGSRRVHYGCHVPHASAPVDWLDSAVWTVFLMTLERARDAWPGSDDSEQGVRLNALRSELAIIEGKLSELAEAYSSDLLTLEQMKTATAMLRQREEEARAQLAEVDTTPTLENLLRPGGLDDLAKAWHTFDLGQQRAAISSVFSVIRLHRRGVRGKGKIPQIDFETTRPLEGFPIRLVGAADMSPAELARLNGWENPTPEQLAKLEANRQALLSDRA
ncbi:recombinase family protein [Propionicimonas sp.]|uniref:recombinase family protein n=1 Tax=Propionicimonas sp. TaxID=1955623 RepID=UPI0039E36059